jgi:hypothetical protein
LTIREASAAKRLRSNRLRGSVGLRLCPPEFRLIDAQLDDIREQLNTLLKYETTFTVEVKDEVGDVVTEVQKVLHIR